MAINQKKTEYFKEFVSKTKYTDTAYHGSPRWEPSQTIGKEDDELREEIISKFALKGERCINLGKGLGHSEVINDPEGFDGKFFYTFRFYSNLGIIKSEENVPYITTIEIKKAGKLENLSTNCDLEDFLLEKRFEKITEKK